MNLSYYSLLTLVCTMLCPDFYRPVYYNIAGYYCYSDLTQHNLEPQCY